MIQRNRFQIRALRDYREVRRSEMYRQALSGDRSDGTCQAAVFLSQSLGYCRLWGVELGDEDGSVPRSLLPMICETLNVRIRELTQGLTQFELRMETTETSEEEELLASTILRQRMDGWACWLAIDERIQMLIAESDERGLQYLALQDSLCEVFNQWDVDMQARADLLLTVLDTHLIENWHNSLAVPFAETMPWWLDEKFWSSVSAQTLQDIISPRQPSPAKEGHTPLADSVARGQPENSHRFSLRWELADPLMTAAATVEHEVRCVEFVSHRSETNAAHVTVTIPTRLKGDDSIDVDIRFSFTRRDPTSVRLGSVVSLGVGAKSVVMLEYPEGEPPLLRTKIRLNRDDVIRLKLQEYVRLTVDGRDWRPRNLSDN